MRADMACEIVDSQQGLITIRISGKLRRAEMAHAEKAAIDIMRSGAKVRFLLLAEGFQGWDNSDDWGNVSFQARYDEQIEKIAIVGEKRWQDLAEAFTGKGLRPVDIRYFMPSELTLAQVWVTQPVAKG
jgi:hypothetical protein